jgi:hypothetical protein
MQFGQLKQHVGSCQFHNTQEVEMVISEWPQKQEPDFCSNRILKLMPKWEKCTDVFGDHVDK